MEQQQQESVAEAAKLRHCLNDLISIMALPALWAGGEPRQIAGTLLDALVGMLQLTFAFVRLNEPGGGLAVEMVRIHQEAERGTEEPDIAQALHTSLGDAACEWPRTAR